MQYSVLNLCLFYNFVAVCSAKEIEIGAVLQLDKDAIQKIAAVLQKPENNTTPEKKYVDYLKEVIKIMKSYDSDKLGEVFHIITENVRKMLEKENITNTNIFKDLSKVKYEIRDQMRRKLLDETLKALEDNSDVGTRHQKVIEEASKDFEKEDIASFITYLKMFKHDTKRTNTKTHGFKKAVNRIVKATMVILKRLKQDMWKSKQPTITTEKYQNHGLHGDEPSFEDKFEYDNQDEGLKMKLDHDYFVMDRLWDELAHNTDKNPLRTAPTPAPISDLDETVTIVPSQNVEILETEFDNTPTPQWKQKHLEKHVLADFNIEVKKTKNPESPKKSENIDDEKDMKNKKEPTELLRQLYPPKKIDKHVKILRQENEKAESQSNSDKEKEKSFLELVKGKAKKLKDRALMKPLETVKQYSDLDTNVKGYKKYKKTEKENNDDDIKMSSELILGRAKNPKTTDFDKPSEYIRGKIKKQKELKIKDSLELIREQIKKHNDKKKVSSELPKVKHRGKAKKPSKVEDEKNSAELLRQLFPPEMKIMNVKILKQENGIPQEIHLQHDALIDVRNFHQRSQNNETN